MSIFQHWFYYVVLPFDPTTTYYSSTFKKAISSLLATESGFWASSLCFPQVKNSTVNIVVKWTRSIVSHLLSSYLSIDSLLLSCVSERFKVWSHTTGQLRASWEKTSTDPIISFYVKFINGITCNSVTIKRIEIMDRSVLLFYRPGVQYEKNRFIIWIPGGGFHALGPNDFLGVGSYLSHCAPVLIFDYPKSPENPYPEALYWIYNAIIFIFEKDCGSFILEHLGSSVSSFKIDADDDEKTCNLIFAGDSAGGNLATILATKLSNEPVPGLNIIGLVLVYPLLSFEINGWLPPEDQKIRAKVAPHLVGEDASGGPFYSRLAIPSRLLNLNDKIIRTDVLCYLAQSYLTRTNNDILDTNRFIIGNKDEYSSSCGISPSDPSLTPLKLPTEMIRALPQVFIQIGELDPFLDDSLILFHKALMENDSFDTCTRTEAGISFKLLKGIRSPNISLSLIEGISHGYLQLQLLWKGFEPCVLEVQNVITSMFGRSSTKRCTSNPNNHKY